MNNKNLIQILVCLLFALGSITDLAAQKTPLNRELTLNAPGISMQDALQLLGEETNLNFSYNSALIDNDRVVSIHAQEDKLSRILDDILNEDIRYKVVGNHIVLLADKSEKVKPKEVERSGYAISGTIYDSRTGEVIRSATIYDIDGERTSITDNEGFYSILLPATKAYKGLTYCKEGYMDTVIIIRPIEDLKIDMQLSPVIAEEKIAENVDSDSVPAAIQLEKPSFTEHRIVDAVIPAEALSHSSNLQLYERKLGQISFLPFAGTHTSRNGVYINRFSLNILAGYTGGVEGLEIGSILNIDRNYVNGVQISGFGNIVGKATRGVQVAGFTNINIGSITGVQVAGFNNVTNDTITGVQVAGFTNYLRGAMNGVQVSGFYNHLGAGANGVQTAGFVNFAGKDLRGAQVAGFANVAVDSVYGAQVSGFANYQRGEMTGGQVAGFANVSAGDLHGIQLAGFGNFALEADSGLQVGGFMNIAVGDYSGFQVAGFANIVEDEFDGVQVAGFINRAKHLSGLQIAPFNNSETSDGLAIGVFNYVKRGYRAFEFSVDEVLLANLTFKTGNKRLYNIFNVGIHPSNTWGVGIGFGSYASLGKRFHIFEEITANSMNESAVWQRHLNMLNKFSMGLDFQFADKYALFAAASFNVHVLGRDRETNLFSTEVPFKPLFMQGGTRVQTSMWIGGKVGVRYVVSE